MGDCRLVTSLLESREGEREVTRERKEEERKWRTEVRDRKRPENMIHTLQIALMLQIRDTNSSYLLRYLQYPLIYSDDPFYHEALAAGLLEFKGQSSNEPRLQTHVLIRAHLSYKSKKPCMCSHGGDLRRAYEDRHNRGHLCGEDVPYTEIHSRYLPGKLLEHHR